MALAGCPQHGSSAASADAAPAATTSASAVTLAPLMETVTPSETASVPPLVTATVATPTTTHVQPTAVTTKTTTKPATPSAQAQLRQCCSAIRKQAREQPSQAAQLNQGAMMCDGLVAALAGAGESATMPELGPLKAMLQGLSLPPVCQGL